MLRAIHIAMGLLLITSGAYLSSRLLAEKDMLILASLGSAILAAIAFGAMLILRAVRR